MKYLKKAFEFLSNNFLLVIPLLVATLIPAILMAPALFRFNSQITKFQTAAMLGQMSQDVLSKMSIDLFVNFLSDAYLGIILSFVLSLFAIPATYGMINKSLSGGNASLGDFFSEFAHNIVKYICWFFACAILAFGISIAFTILLAICVFATSAIMPLGVILTIVTTFAFIVFALMASAVYTVWFPAMLTDDLGAFSALKQAIPIGKSCFWTIFGITLLLQISSFILSSIVGTFVKVAVIATIPTTIIAVLIQFITIVFAFELYRDKTGKQPDLLLNDIPSRTPDEYL